MKTIDPKTPLFQPYKMHHLRKQEDEERAFAISKQVKIRESSRQAIFVQGVNIKTVGQKIADAFNTA
jgi:hypothetical protein